MLSRASLFVVELQNGEELCLGLSVKSFKKLFDQKKLINWVSSKAILFLISGGVGGNRLKSIITHINFRLEICAFVCWAAG